jgi:ribosomal protein S19
MRSKWKIPFIYMEHSQIKKNENTKKKPVLNFKSRDFTITPKLINTSIKIYNGVKFLLVSLKENHVGYKVGNFTVTKKRCIYKKRKKK